MHVPDGFINAPVSVAAGAVAVGAVAVSLRGARRELDERTAPLAGLVAAFIFAVQMLNFPVGAGTSGHLLGGALAAILVGPYTGVLCVSVVLLMQGVLFADGGLTALGVNILDMGVVTVLVAYGIFRALDAVLPRTRGSITGAAFVAALLSVPVSAIAFTGLYALGGTADVALGKVFAAMTGVHVLIGIGEGVITALTVGAVIAVRPDLVHAARGFAAPLSLRTVTPTAPTAPAAPGVPTGSGAPGTPSGAAAADGRTADGPAKPAAAGRSGGPAGPAAGQPGDASAEPAGASAAAGRPGGPAAVPDAAGPQGASAEPSPAARADQRAGGATGTAGRQSDGVSVEPVGVAGRTGDGVTGSVGASDAGTAEPSAEPVVAGTATVADRTDRAAAHTRSARRVWVGGLVATLACAGVVSFYASSSPDGLEKVAADNGIAEEADEHGLAGSPLADYGVEDIADGRLSGGLAGVIGVGATLAVGSGVFVVVRRRRADGRDTTAGASATATATATAPGTDPVGAGGAAKSSVHGKG